MKLLTFLDERICPQVLSPEKCSLEDAEMRVVAQDLHNPSDCPRYDESLRDGFAVCGAGPYLLLDYEAYAGNTAQFQLCAGQACAIMTGGLVPLGADRVIPNESTKREGKYLIALPGLKASSFIRKKGSHKKKGDILVRGGESLTANHLALLADAGIAQVAVTEKPKVAIFSTGSELKDPGTPLLPGQKTASNGLVLSQLVKKFGGQPTNCGVVADSRQALTSFLSSLKEQHYNVIVATGGMGPGRYDLMEECFAKAGGQIVTVSLPLLPGKSCLVGFLGTSIFYGFPGTPSAVRPLFTELVAPPLLQMQGLGGGFPKSLEVTLMGDIEVRPAEVPSLWAGKLIEEAGQLRVKALDRSEIDSSVYIIIPPQTSLLRGGQQVWVHSTERAFYF